MSTPLVLAVLTAAVAAGVAGSRRLVPIPEPSDPPGRATALLVCGLLTAAAVVLALRAYLLVDGLLNVGLDETFSTGFRGDTVGDIVLQGLPGVLVEPGILAALAFLLLGRIRSAG